MSAHGALRDFGSGDCRHMVHLRIRMWKLLGKFVRGCLRSGRPASTPKPPFATYISYTRSRLLNVCVIFRVIGI